MDPTLQAKIDEAKANGYSEEEINSYIASQTNPSPQQGLGPMDRSAEYAGLAEGMGMNALGNAVEYGVPAAGAFYGVKKLIDAYKGPVSPAQMSQAAQVSQPAQLAQAGQAAVNGPAAPNQSGVRNPNLRVAPPGNPNAGAQAFNQMGQQLTRPVAPTSPPPAQAPGMMQTGMDYVSKMRQIAAEKVIQNAGTLAKAGVGIGAATYSAPLGPPVPNKGPYRGMEINPMTGRAWRPEELAQINR
jgi:hypothetical protein